MKIITTKELNAPASVVWQVFGERFGDVADWTDAIAKSTLDGELKEGAVRTCDLKAFGPVPAGKITEELTRFQPSERALTYNVLSGLPKFIHQIENAWTLHDLGDGRTRVQSIATFDIAWWMVMMIPVMRGQMGKGLTAFVNELEAEVARVQAAERAA